MAREQRKLAAIVAADVVGYSRLMGRDESGTLARLRKNRSERLDPVLEKYGGRLVKLTGDGALIEFGSAVDALSAAIEFQQAMADANSDQPAENALVFRMGMHVGDLIVDGDDLYGDGVNVAARLEGEAPAGGIVTSRTVHEAVAGRVKATFDDLGSLDLKNIERPVQGFSVKWEPGDWQQAGVPASQVALPLPHKPSIAVLPFQNMSGDPEQEYFVDGLVEDLITALSRFKSLLVIDRYSSFAYKGRPTDVKQVRRELSVRYVLEGSIRRTADRVRITGQLIDAETGAHLWADRFEGVTENIFDLQDQVTARIIALLAPRLERAEIERACRKPTDNLDAYDCFLRGRASMNPRTKAGVDEALSLFGRATALDPNFAAAHAAATFCYVLRKAAGWVTDRQHDIAETDRLVRRTWALDQDDAEALGYAGYALAFVVGDLSAGAAYVERALTLNPGYAQTLLCSGWIHIWLGQPDVAIDHAQCGLRLDPLGPHAAGMQTVTALAHHITGRYDEAYLWIKKALHQRSDSPPYLRIAAASAAMAGHPDEAARLCARLQQVDPGLRLSNLDETQGPFQELEHYQRLVEGLRLAGLPE